MSGIWCLRLAKARRIGVAALSRLRYRLGAEPRPAAVTAPGPDTDLDLYEGLMERPEW